MKKILTISNHKGGVGKSTTTSCLATALAEQGKKVLAIDLDPHAGLTTTFGIDFLNLPLTSYDFIKDPRGHSFESFLVKTTIPEVSLIGANKQLSNIEQELTNKIGFERFLKKALENVPNNYDYILMDCPPFLGILTVNALMACMRVEIDRKHL